MKTRAQFDFMVIISPELSGEYGKTRIHNEFLLPVIKCQKTCLLNQMVGCPLEVLDLPASSDLDYDMRSSKIA